MEKIEDDNSFEKDISDINLNENKKNSEVELKEYIIISKYFEQNEDGEDNNTKEIYLPTWESLQKICNSKLVKDFINFDLEKYKSNFINNNNNNNNSASDEKLILNLDNILSKENINIIPYILIFLGGINSENSIYDFFDEQSILNPDYECFIDYNINYLEYLNKIIVYLKQQLLNDYLYFKYSNLNLLFNSLFKLGIDIKIDDKNIIYRNLKDSIFANEKNKILVLIAPSHTFWFKSDAQSIKNQIYDKKLNNFKNIFYNETFIHNFYEKVVNHLRCKFGILSSMTLKNIKSCYEGLKIINNKKYSNLNPIIIGQDCHDSMDQKTFYRNIKKIIEYLKKNEYDNFDEKNIIIIESKEEKIGDTKNNSIIANIYNEDYIGEDKDKKIKNENQGNKVIKYIIDLLENCNDDIRLYINNNIFFIKIIIFIFF